jgi:glycosyltransferase involved in cell wall biosynthesis
VLNQRPRITVIVPAYNAERVLPLCLGAIRQSELQPDQLIVVDDGSTDRTAEIAEGFHATLLRTTRQSGPAVARNLGAEAADGDLLVFFDSDVTIHPDTLSKISAAFQQDPELGSLIGSYDQEPGHEGFLSKYRNLMHSYFHQSGKRSANTFWGACGAVRKEIFFQAGGFDVSFARPSIEDIELGYRMRRAGVKMMLDPDIHVKHLKHWTLGNMLRTDVRDRAIPWTQLMIREGKMPDDLNTSMVQRASVALSALVPGLVLFDAALALFCWLALISLNWRFYRFLGRNWGWLQSAAASPLHYSYYLYSGLGFVLGTAAYYLMQRPAWLNNKAR